MENKKTNNLPDEQKNIILKKVGENIKSVRNKIGMSIDNVAYRANLDRRFIDRIEKGKKNPTLYSLCKIAKALDVNPKCFFIDYEW